MRESLFALSLMVVGSTIATSFITTIAAVGLVRALTGKVTGRPRVLGVEIGPHSLPRSPIMTPYHPESRSTHR